MDLGAQTAAGAAKGLIFRPPFFWPLRRAGRGRWWNRRSVGGVRNCHEDAPPGTLVAPLAETAEDTVPVSEYIGEIAPGSARAHDPKHRFHEHSVVAARRTSRPFISDDVRRNSLPLVVAKDQAVENTHGCLQKSALMMWTPPPSQLALFRPADALATSASLTRRTKVRGCSVMKVWGDADADTAGIDRMQRVLSVCCHWYPTHTLRLGHRCR